MAFLSRPRKTVEYTVPWTVQVLRAVQGVQKKRWGIGLREIYRGARPRFPCQCRLYGPR